MCGDRGAGDLNSTPATCRHLKPSQAGGSWESCSWPGLCALTPLCPGFPGLVCRPQQHFQHWPGSRRGTVPVCVLRAPSEELGRQVSRTGRAQSPRQERTLGGRWAVWLSAGDSLRARLVLHGLQRRLQPPCFSCSRHVRPGPCGAARAGVASHRASSAGDGVLSQGDSDGLGPPSGLLPRSPRMQGGHG